MRTLTHLYNDSPNWLQAAHRRLDEAVALAYGWPADISEDEALAALLELNQARSLGEQQRRRATPRSATQLREQPELGLGVFVNETTAPSPLAGDQCDDASEAAQEAS
jgi:hypothetical protein